MMQRMRRWLGLTLTKLEVADRFILAYEHFFPGCSCLIAGELKVSWSFGMSEPVTEDLHALWVGTQRLSRSRGLQLVDEAAAQLGEANDFITKRNKSAPQRLYPVVRSRHHGTTAISLQIGMPHRFLTNDLVVYYVIDDPGTQQPVWDKHLADLNIARDQLESIALANLRNIELRPRVSTKEDVIIIKGDQYYESSLIVDNVLIDDIERRFGCEFVVLIPCPDEIIFARTDSALLGEVLESAVESFLNHKKPISKDPLIRRNGQWSVWQVPEELRPPISIQ